MAIIGHKRQIQYLNSLIKSGKVPHAFIFVGPDYLGKRLVAESFFCNLVGIDELPQTHSDIFILNKGGEGGISIKQIRELKKFIGLSPFNFSKKLVLIDDAHQMNRESFNSLLKTLEEPSKETYIIMVTSNLDYFPKTITSRSYVLKFNNLGKQEITSALGERGAQIKDEDWPWIAGRPGLAMRYVTNPQDSLVVQIKDGYFSFLNALRSGTIFDRFALASQVYSAENLPVIIESWLLAAREVIEENPNSSPKMLNNISSLRQALAKTNVNKRLQIENTFLSF